MSCIVEGCAMVKRFKPKGITFHRLPKGNQLKRWLQVLGRDDQTFVWSENKMICSKHFQEDDFIKGPERSRLKPNAVPSLHLRKSSKKEESTTLTVQSDVIECPHLEQPSSSSVSSLHLEMSQKKEEETIFSVPHDIETSENKSQGLEQSSSSFSSGKSSDDAIKSSLRKNVKRHIGESSGQESSKSSSSGKRRKTAKLIQFFHNYSVSPGKYKRKYIQLRKTQMKTRQRLYASKKTIKK